MVARVASVLTAGSVGGQPIDVDHMAVITFTEFAAAELMSRVRERLEDLAESGEAPDPERIEVALRNLHRAHVETIHAFCISLLRERYGEVRASHRRVGGIRWLSLRKTASRRSLA